MFFFICYHGIKSCRYVDSIEASTVFSSISVPTQLAIHFNGIDLIPYSCIIFIYCSCHGPAWNICPCMLNNQHSISYWHSVQKPMMLSTSDHCGPQTHSNMSAELPLASSHWYYIYHVSGSMMAITHILMWVEQTSSQLS